VTDLRRENGWRDDLWDGGIKRGRELQAKEDKAEIDALRAQLTDTQAALAEAVEALKELAYSPVAFTDDRISYVEMQVDKDVLETAKKALEVSADD
jgi:hypothetical protein